MAPLGSIIPVVTILSALVIACTLAASAALAFDTYVVDIKARNSKIIPKWQSIVPAPFAANAWINSLDGLSPPTDGLILFYKKFHLGWVCWPQDCPGNRVVFLIAQDGSEAYGMLRSKTLKANDVFFGAPSDENKVRLRDHLDR